MVPVGMGVQVGVLQLLSFLARPPSVCMDVVLQPQELFSEKHDSEVTLNMSEDQIKELNILK